jgi:hypothetical protein
VAGPAPSLRQGICGNRRPHWNRHREIQELSCCGHDRLFLLAGGQTVARHFFPPINGRSLSVMIIPRGCQDDPWYNP